MNKYKTYGQGWWKESLRHSLARRYGKAPSRQQKMEKLRQLQVPYRGERFLFIDGKDGEFVTVKPMVDNSNGVKYDYEWSAPRGASAIHTHPAGSYPFPTMADISDTLHNQTTDYVVSRNFIVELNPKAKIEIPEAKVSQSDNTFFYKINSDTDWSMDDMKEAGQKIEAKKIDGKPLSNYINISVWRR